MSRRATKVLSDKSTQLEGDLAASLVEGIMTQARELGRIAARLHVENATLRRQSDRQDAADPHLAARIEFLLDAIRKRDALLDERAEAIKERDEVIALLKGADSIGVP